MAPQDPDDPPPIGPESKQLTIGEYRGLAFRGPTETVIDENDGNVYELKKNPIHPDHLGRQLDDPDEEYQREIDWNEIDKSVTGTLDENEVLKFTQDKDVSDHNPWTIPHLWARKVGGGGRWYPRDRHGARIVKTQRCYQEGQSRCVRK